MCASDKYLLKEKQPGRPPGNAAVPRQIPRGVEVLVKKAAVDPKFKQILFEKRAEAAQAIDLKLSAAEEAMLAAVPLPQLEGIIAHTRVSPKLRPAFLGYAAGAMLAVLGSATIISDSEVACPPGRRPRGPGHISGGTNTEESRSRRYGLSGGAAGRGYVTAITTIGSGSGGMRADRPRGGYGRHIPSSGGSGGMRGDYPPGTGGLLKRILPKNVEDPRRRSKGHLHCTGSRADYPEDSNKEEPAPYLVAADSRNAGRVSYRSAAGMQDYINKKLPGIRNAYDTAADNNPALGGGKIVVRFDVAPDGHVVEAEITEDTLGDATLRCLILSRVRSWKFPGGGEADVTVEYPFVFVAEKE